MDATNQAAAKATAEMYEFFGSTDFLGSKQDNSQEKAEAVEARTIITREIGIDMGHRVTNHGSKCRNVHGHRYRIELGVFGITQAEGEQNPQEGMLIDFGFLKEEMMNWIDSICDHGMVLWRQDHLVISTLTSTEIQLVDDFIAQNGYGCIPKQEFWGKIVVVPFVPTAENLCKWWFQLLEEPIKRRSQGLSEIAYVKAWETPNCSAMYTA